MAHRGASGHRPEHTLGAYALAARMGADCLEPDLVVTRDGVLVARHENEIGATTDVAEHAEFAARATTKTIDGVAVSGWFTEDFTLAELKTLRARERIPELRPGNVAWDGREAIPTLAELLELREELSRELGRELVVYPETKHPAYFRALDLALEEPLAAALREHGLAAAGAPVFLQSFERESLERLRSSGLAAPLVQLLAAPGDLAEIATYADAVGPAKSLLLPRGADDGSLPPTTFVADAHALGLRVHAWTFRAENAFLPAELRRGADPAAHGDLAAELRTVAGLGVDGVFTDHPDVAVRVLDHPP